MNPSQPSQQPRSRDAVDQVRALPFPCNTEALEPRLREPVATPSAPETPLPRSLEAVRWTLILLLWAGWLLYCLLSILLHGCLARGRFRALVTLGSVAALFTLGLMYVPVAWGWMELEQEAEFLARHADEMDDERIVLAMKSRAYRQGFVEVVGRDDLVTVERSSDDMGPRCRVRMTIAHSPRLGSLVGPKLPIRVDVVRTVLPPQPSPIDGLVQ